MNAEEKISILVENHCKDLEWNNGHMENWIEAWYELVYCILAGSKVNTKIVQKAYKNLIEFEPEKALFTNLILRPDCIEYLKSTLKMSGYRFYNSKAEAIVNAAFFYNRNFSSLENDEIDPKKLRASLVRNVNGIGIKIATHWLRNIGFDFPIVDVHTRNILIKAGVLDGKFKKQSLSTNQYLFVEKIMFDLSKKLSKPAGSLDYALWKHGMERCKCTIL